MKEITKVPYGFINWKIKLGERAFYTNSEENARWLANILDTINDELTPNNTNDLENSDSCNKPVINKKERNKSMKTVIMEYIKKNHKRQKIKVGVIVGVKQGKTIKVGWSKCNYKAGDKFNKEEGIKIALKRVHGGLDSPSVPNSIKAQIRQFSSRCFRYFKDTTSLQTVGE